MAYQIEYPCDHCEQRIADDEGAIFIRGGELDQFEQMEREYEPEHGGTFTLEDLAAMPRLVEWRVSHYECDPDAGDAFYWFDVRRARTHEHLLAWTAHLGEKDWFWKGTNWSSFLYRHVKPLEPGDAPH